MNSNWYIIAILLFFVVVTVLADRFSGPGPSKKSEKSELSEQQQRIVRFQGVIFWLGVANLVLFRLIQPRVWFIWFFGSIGLFYLGISAIVYGVSDSNFKGLKGPATGSLAVAMGVIWMFVAYAISALVWSSPERPLPFAE